MAPSEALEQPTADRVTTGVDGLDKIIEGGYPKGDLILIAGHPGTGKTLLSSQFLYNGAHTLGESGVYVSFAENREAFLRNMRRTGMDFESLERDRLFKFMDLVTVKEKAIDEILSSVIAEVDSIGTKRLVIDSFSAMAQAFTDKIEARIVLHTVLGRITRLNGVTTLLIVEKPFGSRVMGGGMEEFVSDAVMILTQSLDKGRVIRNLNIVKMRGTRTPRTRLNYEIKDEGLVVYSPLTPYAPSKIFDERVSTGIDGLDKMLSGGMYKGSTIFVLGESGTGKTTSALQFLMRGAQNGEKTLFTSYEESADELVRHGRSFGWKLSELLEKQQIKFMSFSPDPDNILGIFADIRREIRDFQPARLVVDSLSSIERTMDSDQLFQTIRRLTTLGKSKGITCLATARTSDGSLPSDFQASALADVILSLRQVESQSMLRRALVVFKSRGSPLDSSIREFVIGPNGLVVEGRFSDLEQILSGSAHKSATVERWSDAFTGRPSAKAESQN